MPAESPLLPLFDRRATHEGIVDSGYRELHFMRRSKTSSLGKLRFNGSRLCLVAQGRRGAKSPTCRIRI